ncbi:hypothetical protein VI03_29255 [Burkholderia vietnamiensis]|nr:hypothetical protein VI03_29255 [Burkholderia vietnamiensis]
MECDRAAARGGGRPVRTRVSRRHSACGLLWALAGLMVARSRDIARRHVEIGAACADTTR